MTLQRTFERKPAGKRWTTLLVALAVAVMWSSAAVAGIDEQADGILKSMSAHLEGLNAFSVSAEIDNELVNLEGQKMQLSSSSTIVIERPSRFRMTREGMFADAELTFDGAMLTLYGNNANSFMQMPVAGTVDDAIRALEQEIGFDAPGADLLFGNPYPILSSGVESSHYIGVAVVNGVRCHHLAFREEQVDWQLWVQEGDTPLPMKYVITTKWVTGAPQYSIRFSDWNPNPKHDAGIFTFVAPKGAQQIDTLEVNEMGELRAHEGGAE